jgi:lysylphosphatidylglycerol synthetase-like protein (DUF2156 family)
LHFLVEPEVLDGFLEDRLVLTARRNGAVVAFALASPIPARHGYLLEVLARSRFAPNGTSELLIDAAMHHAAEQSCTYMTLGWSPWPRRPARRSLKIRCGSGR